MPSAKVSGLGSDSPSSLCCFAAQMLVSTARRRRSSYFEVALVRHWETVVPYMTAVNQHSGEHVAVTRHPENLHRCQGGEGARCCRIGRKSAARCPWQAYERSLAAEEAVCLSQPYRSHFEVFAGQSQSPEKIRSLRLQYVRDVIKMFQDMPYRAHNPAKSSDTAETLCCITPFRRADPALERPLKGNV